MVGFKTLVDGLREDDGEEGLQIQPGGDGDGLAGGGQLLPGGDGDGEEGMQEHAGGVGGVVGGGKTIQGGAGVHNT